MMTKEQRNAASGRFQFDLSRTRTPIKASKKDIDDAIVGIEVFFARREAELTQHLAPNIRTTMTKKEMAMLVAETARAIGEAK